MDPVDERRVRPFTVDVHRNGFVAYVKDIDLANSGASGLQDFAALLEEYPVLVCRGQSLSPVEQLRLTRAFGKPHGNKGLQFCVPEYPEVYILGNKAEGGRCIGDTVTGQGWHTDSSFVERPMLCTLLHAVEVPLEGSDTIISDLRLSWESLSPYWQGELLEMRVIHSLNAIRQAKGLALDDVSGRDPSPHTREPENQEKIALG